MNLLLLIIAFVLTGVNLISMKALIQWGLGRYSMLFLLAYWTTAMVISLIVLAVSRRRAQRPEVTIGSIMGLCGAGGLLFMMFALRGISGVVAFPVRSCGNIALTAGLAYAIWREDISPMQWLGIACGVVAIYLLV